MKKKHNQYLTPKVTCRSFIWPNSIELIIKEYCKEKTLHLCSGRSNVGDIRIDKIIWKKWRKYYSKANMIADADKIPFKDSSFPIIVTDPIYNKIKPPFIDEIIRVLKPSGKLIYFYPAIPYHEALSLTKLYVYPNAGLNYLRLLSVSINNKLDLKDKDNDNSS